MILGIRDWSSFSPMCLGLAISPLTWDIFLEYFVLGKPVTLLELMFPFVCLQLRQDVPVLEELICISIVYSTFALAYSLLPFWANSSIFRGNENKGGFVYLVSGLRYKEGFGLGKVIFFNKRKVE